MKIGILTFHFADNYGAVLQAYGLKKALEKEQGSTVSVINYVSRKFSREYSINPFHKLQNPKTFLKYCCLYPKKIKQVKLFRFFRQRELGITEKPQSTLRLQGYDVVVAGSDQIWNTAITAGDMGYFLPQEGAFARVSYGASADDAFPPASHREEIARNLKRFRGVSVRETPLAEKLAQLGISAQVVCDPVLLHSREFWEEVGQLPRGIPSRYIFMYVLRPNEKLEAAAEALSRRERLPVLVAHPQGRRLCRVGTLRRDIGPGEFVAMVKNAEYVVSNSFHAFAFSFLFSRKIIFEYLPGLANRVKSLMDVLKLKPQAWGEDLCYLEMNGYGSPEHQAYRESSEEFIRGRVFGRE